MTWPRIATAILLAGAFLTGCAGAEHELPEITQAESYSAAQKITAAPNLSPTTRTRSENERMARKVLGKLQKVARPLCYATEQDKCWYTLELSPDGEMNAYVVKNEIVVHNGLAQYLHTEDEFAVVVAHEMGHHIAHHYEKGAQNRAVGAAIAGLIFLGISNSTNAYQYNPSQQQRDMQNYMKIGAAVGNISFSKEHEREADYVAAYLMARAGYDPEAGSDVWIKLTKASGDIKTGLFDTHPAGPDRLAGWQRSANEVRHSVDLMPNFADAEYEPRLQQARVFGHSETNIQVNTAALSSSTSSSSKESASALTSSVSPANSLENKRLLSQTDPEICGFALEADYSSKFETPRWRDYSTFREYVDEAKRRGFSAHSCAAIFGWRSAQKNPRPEVAINAQQLKKTDHSETQEKLQGARIWHTSRTGVFAYSEPGGEGDRIEMPEQVDLKLILQRGEWGIFEYAAGGGGSGRGWISMKSVKLYR